MNPRETRMPSYFTDIIGGFLVIMNSSFENPLSDLKHEIKQFLTFCAYNVRIK
jgi:hypothetical protein